jgi:hypothetical protein
MSLFVSLLSAQTDRATLTGVVMDPSRSVVRTAKVTLHAAATGLTYAGLTNAAGIFTFGGLPVGEYSALIVAAGFESLQIQTFTLEVVRRARSTPRYASALSVPT